MLANISLPDGLTTDVPRAARFTTSTQLLRLFLLSLFILVVGVFWRSSAREVATMEALDTRGLVTAAGVYGKSVTTHKAINYWLGFSFSGNGVQVNGYERVSPDVYARTQPGATIMVTYLPSDPQTYRVGLVTRARVQAEQSRGFWTGFIAFVFFGLPLLFTELIFRQHLSLLRGGSVAVGTIAGLQGPRILQKHKTFYVTYQFAADGRWYSNKVTCSKAFYKHSRPGQGLIILYSPTHPSRSVPYGMLSGVALSKR